MRHFLMVWGKRKCPNYFCFLPSQALVLGRILQAPEPGLALDGRHSPWILNPKQTEEVKVGGQSVSILIQEGKRLHAAEQATVSFG